MYGPHSSSFNNPRDPRMISAIGSRSHLVQQPGSASGMGLARGYDTRALQGPQNPEMPQQMSPLSSSHQSSLNFFSQREANGSCSTAGSDFEQQSLTQEYYDPQCLAEDSVYACPPINCNSVYPIPCSQDYNPSSRFCPTRRAPKFYICEICDKKFVRPSSLTTHRLSHTGEKPHSCTTCGKSFSVASNLRRHEMTIHGPRQQNDASSSSQSNSQINSGGLQSAAFVGSTNSSVLYRRGGEIYENLLPSHERFQHPQEGPSYPPTSHHPFNPSRPEIFFPSGSLGPAHLL